MKQMVLATTALVLLAGVARAEDGAIPQASSPWYTEAEAALQVQLTKQPNTHRAKNVILFIADGNGVGTNYMIRLFDGQSQGKLGEEHVLPYEAFPYSALIKTYNVNAQTPDSAPTAGAMNTGVKQIFNTINLDPEKAIVKDCRSEEGAALKTFAEIMTGEGRAVGVVTTARITHATPAAVYAKTAYRDWESVVDGDCPNSKDIAVQLFNQMQAGVVDIALGGGRRHFAPKGVNTEEAVGGAREDNRNLIAEMQQAGIQYVWNTETFRGAKFDGTTPILGLFEGSHMKYEADRTDTDEPSLSEMTRAAIGYLAKNQGGYYLEVEAGRVDTANHEGNAYRTMVDGAEYAKAVALADELTDDNDTLLIATADHEHSIAFNGYCGRGNPILGLCMGISKGKGTHTDKPELAADGKPYTVVGYLSGPGAVLTEQADKTFTAPEGRPTVTEEEATDRDYVQQALIPQPSETHSGVDVALYAKGPWAHLFDGVQEQNYIFHVMKYAAMAGDQGTESVKVTEETKSAQ